MRRPRRHSPLAALALAAALVPAAHAQTSAQTSAPRPTTGPATGTWTLGLDAVYASRDAVLDGYHDLHRTQLDLPRAQLRVGYQLTPALQLELPVALRYETANDAYLTQATVGADLNLTVAARARLRPIVGAGARLAYRRSGRGGLVSGDAAYNAAQYGYAARLGLEWQALPALSVRPALFYERMLENSKRDLPRTDAYGVSLGATASIDRALAAAPAPVQLSVSTSLSRVASGSLPGAFAGDGSSRHSTTVLAAPAASVGLFVPVATGGRVAVGANVQATRQAVRGASLRLVDVQPRVELNLNPRFRAERGLRLGLHGIVDEAAAREEGRSDSFTRVGAGGDLSLTFPQTPSLLTRFGVGFDYLPAVENRGVPSLRTFSLRFGADML